MKKLGRPPTNGKQPAWMFYRMMFALYAYNEARASTKHSSAISEAICFVRSQFPEVPISETEVKRVIAQLQPRGSLSPTVFRNRTMDRLCF